MTVYNSKNAKKGEKIMSETVKYVANGGQTFLSKYLLHTY